MTEPRFIQIHYLTAYPASLLNRDDAGLAKRVPFGGAVRTRISSQCLKRHWRMADGIHSLRTLDASIGMSVRSRLIFEEKIVKELLSAKDSLKEDAIRAAARAIQDAILGKSEKAKKAEEDDENEAGSTEQGKKDKAEDAASLETNQVIVLGPPEIKFLRDLTRKIARELPAKDPEKKAEELVKARTDLGKDLKALGKAASGLDGAVFGRMVTSDILARSDAAVHVAHAFTVHVEQAESDYFTAVDDLLAASGELGSGHINQTELTTGVYYGYVVVDIPLLVANMEGCDRTEWMKADRKLAAGVVERLVHLIATVTPGAKVGATAPYAFAQMVLLEAGARQPRTLANAFLKPVEADASGGLLENAVSALGDHVKAYERMYGAGEERRVVAMMDVKAIPAADGGSLPAMASWAASLVKGG
jgi:CRISPR system Cascade subunit CasC